MPDAANDLRIGRRYRITSLVRDGRIEDIYGGHNLAADESLDSLGRIVKVREGKYIGVDRFELPSGYAFTRTRKEGGVFVVPLDSLENAVEL